MSIFVFYKYLNNENNTASTMLKLNIRKFTLFREPWILKRLEMS